MTDRTGDGTAPTSDARPGRRDGSATLQWLFGSAGQPRRSVPNQPGDPDQVPPRVGGRAGRIKLRQRRRRAVAIRELKRSIRDAPSATVRNDLMTIAARNERIMVGPA
jgi:hypothetical protein